MVTAMFGEALSSMLQSFYLLQRLFHECPAALELEEWLVLLMPLHRFHASTSSSTGVALLQQEMSLEQMKAWIHFE